MKSTHYELRTARNMPVMRFDSADRARNELRERAPRYGGTLRLVEVRTETTETEIAA